MFARKIICLLTALCLFTPVAQADQVTIFAAASLKTALDEITDGKDVTISYAASSAIARQIELGAPADIVITANTAWMDHLEVKSRLVPDTRRDLLGNELVLIAPSDMVFIAQANRPVSDIVGQERLAMALTEAVPAGIYGKEALLAAGAWNAVEPNIIQTDNVRAALRLVALGEAVFGIVYTTDANAEPRVQIVHLFAPETHTPIRYPMAIVRDRADVRALYDHLQSAQAAKIFTRHGFTPLQGAEP